MCTTLNYGRRGEDWTSIKKRQKGMWYYNRKRRNSQAFLYGFFGIEKIQLTCNIVMTDSCQPFGQFQLCISYHMLGDCNHSVAPSIHIPGQAWIQF